VGSGESGADLFFKVRGSSLDHKQKPQTSKSGPRLLFKHEMEWTGEEPERNAKGALLPGIPVKGENWHALRLWSILGNPPGS
jgi:hypothetical protein